MKEIWYPELMEYGKNLKIVGLIGNKADSFFGEQVTLEQGKKFAKEINAVFTTTSTLDEMGICYFFDELIINI